MKIKEEYKKLASKYKLPNYDDIDLDFEISAIEKHEFLLRAIRRKILDKFDGIKSILENVLHPDASSFLSIYETRLFNDEERKKIYNLYKTFMIIERTANILNLKTDEKEDAKFITKTFEDWQKIKPDLMEFLKKIKEGWQKETNVKEDLGYLG